MSMEVPPAVTRARSKSQWVLDEETADVHELFDFGKKLGQAGQFGEAYFATRKSTGEEVAIKRINKVRFIRKGRSKTVFKDFRREIRVMETLSHANVIRYFEAYETMDALYLVMELCRGGELFDQISARGSYNEADAAKIVRQIVTGIQYMHSKGVVHCDLKPDNFLFLTTAEDSPLKIIDFGMAKFLKARHYFKKFAGTPYYIAPEVLDKRYDEACDMWSIGVVIFVMLHGYPPFYADPSRYGNRADERVYQLIKQGFIPEVRPNYGNWFPEAIPISESARDLIAKLLEPDHVKRLTASEALEHPWFSGKASTEPIHASVLKSLNNFNRTNKFKECVLHLMTDSLQDHEVQALTTSFKNMDKNGDGVLTVEEMREALNAYKTQYTEEQIQRMVSLADFNGDGVLSYEELLLTRVQRKLVSKEERLWRAFCEIDVNGDERISAEELLSAWTKIHAEWKEAPSIETCKRLIAEVDQNGDGYIDYDEFVEQWAVLEENEAGPEAAALASATGADQASSSSSTS